MADEASTHETLPPLHAMLGAAGRFLEKDVLPRLDSAVALQLRMVIRQLAIGERELLLGPKLQADEKRRLDKLMVPSGDLPGSRVLLARQVRARGVDAPPRLVHEHLASSVRALLAIDNPAWATSPRALEEPENQPGDKP